MTSGLFLTARSGPSPAPPGGPAGRYLTSPGGYTGHLARLLLSALAQYGPAAGPLLAVAVTAVIAGRAWPGWRLGLADRDGLGRLRPGCHRTGIGHVRLDLPPGGARQPPFGGGDDQAA